MTARELTVQQLNELAALHECPAQMAKDAAVVPDADLRHYIGRALSIARRVCVHRGIRFHSALVEAGVKL